ncbi:MAG: family 10 glycosylhydrolase [Paludibacteraceae bacterium]|nr:family 10 glycosylhydrolase [Paludibacteraceae bacterium]
MYGLKIRLLLLCLSVAAGMQTALGAERQFRAVWFSTVANIDWPSEQAVGHARMQKEEMTALLDKMQALNMNTVIFQVRPTADALFKSELEPWSAWLTGKQGQDNDETYDPLQTMVEEAHKRRMDVHVWINPYRVTLAKTPVTELDSGHLFFRRPEMFWKYNGQWYFEPGLDETRLWLCSVVADLVRRYDIQGVHMDDYFYPYPDRKTPLPDSVCFRNNPRDFDNIEDWRRNNVNMAICELHDTIKAIKPEVQFGISPFGIWRNKSSDPRGSATNGLQNYDDLYADVLLWMEEGWIDYVVPQLYWAIGSKAADHAELARWWAAHCCKTRLYIGLATYRQQDPKQAAREGKKLNRKDPWSNGNEICRQLRLHKSIPQIEGEVFFSLKPLLKNPMGLCDSLRRNYFSTYVEAPLPLPAPVE